MTLAIVALLHLSTFCLRILRYASKHPQCLVRTCCRRRELSVLSRPYGRCSGSTSIEIVTTDDYFRDKVRKTGAGAGDGSDDDDDLTWCAGDAKGAASSA